MHKHKLKRLRRREVPIDVHSEDEEEFDARGVLEFSDISDSEPSCEDSDVESEVSHSEGEEETQEETSFNKEESTTREELSLIKEKDANSINKDKDASSLVEDKISTSSEDISETVIRSKEAKKSISTDKQKESQLDIKQGENDATIVIKDSDVGDDISSTDDDDELQSHSGDENEAQGEKRNDSQNSVDISEMSGWQKKVLARQEYRKKLAEDPAFVPHLGEFWGHDDRFIKDELKDDFDSHHRKSSFASRGKSVWGNSPPRGRWDHDGFEELMRIEDDERRRKEFQRRIQHRREFVPPTSRRRSHFDNNITPPPKFNHSRPSNSIGRRRNSFEEKSRSRGMFLSKYDTKSKGRNINSNDFNQHHKSNVRESRSENSYSGNSGNITSTSRFNDNKPFGGKDNSFLSKSGRGRGYSSRHYLRSNQDHLFNSNQADVGKVDQDKKSKEQHLNGDDADNIKDSLCVHNAGQNECHENELEDKNTVAKDQFEKIESAQDSSRVNFTSSSSTKEGIELGSPTIKEQERICGESDEEPESEVEIILDSHSKKVIEDNETHPISQSINNVTSSFNDDLSINNNNQTDTTGSFHSTLMDKDRIQTNQASKRYSTRRAASSSITQPTEPPMSGISNNSRTSEIPPSAVFAPPFQPRALALSDENSISNEVSPNNLFPHKPETPITYYTDNLPQGLLPSENNLPQSTSISTPAPYVTESNGMVYYYDPNMYYYYYPTHATPELKDTNDKSSFVPPTNVQENNGVYYYYPVYYQ